MLEVGHEFERNGINYCVVDIVDYENKSYCLLSIEKENEKISFAFYEYKVEMNGDFTLDSVEDEELISKLFDIFEEKK